MEYIDSKPRKIKAIGKSAMVIFNKRKAKEKGFDIDDDVELIIRKNGIKKINK